MNFDRYLFLLENSVEEFICTVFLIIELEIYQQDIFENEYLSKHTNPKKKYLIE